MRCALARDVHNFMPSISILALLLGVSSVGL